MATHFTDEKSRQLVFYASRFLRGQLPHHELHLFIWDTLEEWAALQQRPTTPPHPQERVFWDLLHHLECRPLQQVLHNKRLKRNLQLCLGFIAGKAQKPLNCVGLRP